MSEGIQKLQELIDLFKEYIEEQREWRNSLSIQDEQFNQKQEKSAKEIVNFLEGTKTDFVIKWIQDHNAQQLSTRKIVEKIAEEGVSVSHSLVGKAKKVINGLF